MMKTRLFMNSVVVISLVSFGGCAHKTVDAVSSDQAARIDRKFIKDSVTYGPGAEDGAVIPEVSSPCLHAEVVPEHLESGGHVLVEKHRQWHLQCDSQILGIPVSRRK